jgi:hypothetical protein
LLQIATAAAIVCTAAAIFLPAAASAEAPHLTPIQPVAWVVDSGPQNLVSSVR